MKEPREWDTVHFQLKGTSVEFRGPLEGKRVGVKVGEGDGAIRDDFNRQSALDLRDWLDAKFGTKPGEAEAKA